ncbi:unnamed protein product [Candida verbasci]|uniref:Pyrroline-5-carboxylate reductase n=1 Tax=Candida verbasci TaxID=1227364 RepID=A0A9W4TZY5_9ASCO|nr:unnamed protein product [Candida verbasci]
MKDITIAILGSGVMGTAVATAILKTLDPKIIACGTNEARLRESFQDYPQVEISAGIEQNKDAIKKADVIILGCKPFMYQQIYNEISSSLNGSQLLISLLAGTTIKELSIFTPYVAKVMTNTPAKFGCGTAAISYSSETTQDKKDLVEKLISTIGLVVNIPEKNMDAATALIGSGPAFVLLMMESLIDGGVRMGLPFDIAKQSAAKVMEGTAKMVLETGEHPAVLKSKVCTPAGTTIGGLLKMEDGNIRSSIARGVEEAANISASFAKK